MAAGDRTIVLDLSMVSFIEAVALGVEVGGPRRVRAGCLLWQWPSGQHMERSRWSKGGRLLARGITRDPFPGGEVGLQQSVTSPTSLTTTSARAAPANPAPSGLR